MPPGAPHTIENGDCSYHSLKWQMRELTDQVSIDISSHGKLSTDLLCVLKYGRQILHTIRGLTPVVALHLHYIELEGINH